MSINQFKPERVNPGDDDHERLVQAWISEGRPRRVVYSNIMWMQISDELGVCFVPQGPMEGMNQSFYEQSSFKGIN